MKKLLIITIIAGAGAFTSCKKDYTCSCTYTSTGSPSTTSKFTVKEVTKKQAEAKCNSGTETITVSGFGLTQTKSCTLD